MTTPNTCQNLEKEETRKEGYEDVSYINEQGKRPLFINWKKNASGR